MRENKNGTCLLQRRAYLSREIAVTLIVVEVIRTDGEQSSHKLRVHPLAGQGFDEKARVRCPVTPRGQGKLFLADVQMSAAGQRSSYPYIRNDAELVPLTREAAQKFIATSFRNG